MRGPRRLTKLVLSGLGAVALVMVGAAALVTSSVDGAVRGRIYASPANAPSRPVALVLGAEVYANGNPSPALVKRLDTSIELYRSGKVRALLMSGGHGSIETSAMRRYALAAGVPRTTRSSSTMAGCGRSAAASAPAMSFMRRE